MHALLLALFALAAPPPPGLCALFVPPRAELEREPVVGVGILVDEERIELLATAAVTATMHEHTVATEIEVARGARIVIERAGPPVAQAKNALCPAPFRGELILWVDGMELGRGDSLIALHPADGGVALEAPNVSFAQGYSWGGVARRRYRGDILVTFGKTGLLAAVNRLPIEELLLGVVPSEMPARAPAEALKAQAIAARNFVVTGMGHVHAQDPFDFCSEQHCQVYGGFGDETVATNQAVHLTRGEVLFLGAKPVRAKYSARCGGHTEDNEVAWAERPDEALRGRSDLRSGVVAPLAARLEPHLSAWCDEATSPRLWQQELSAAQLAALLGPRAAHIGPLRDIRGEGRGPGGRLKKLVVTGEHGQWTLARELPIRRALGQLRSAAIELVPTRDAEGRLISVTIRGIGWGHGVGMCQQGAMARARAGQSCGSILGHYYAGARVRPLWSDTVRGCP